MTLQIHHIESSGAPKIRLLRGYTFWLVIASVMIFAACSADTIPQRPFSVPHHFNVANNTTEFDIELRKEIGFELVLSAAYRSNAERLIARAKLCGANSGEFPIRSGKDYGIPIQFRIQILDRTRGDKEVVSEIRMTTDCDFWSADGTNGTLARSVYGTVLTKGKYKVRIPR